MQTDRIVMRPRPQAEAMDLGFQLVRANWTTLAGLTLMALLPVAGLAAALFLWWPPLALLTLWWFKPGVDRALLHLLGNDLTGQTTRPMEILRQRNRWWRGAHLASLTLLRFHPARSARLPVWQLEQLTGTERKRRVRALGYGDRGGGIGLTLIGSMFELSLMISLILLGGWLLPGELSSALQLNSAMTWEGGSATAWALIAMAYFVTVILVEPFYVGGGFGLYLNQRCRLECWDLQPILRRIGQRAHGQPGTSTAA